MPEGRPRHLLAVIAAASLLAHGCLVLAVALLDAPPNLPATVREIPVEVVTAPPSQETPPAKEKSPMAPDASKLDHPTSREPTSTAPHDTTEPQPAAAGGEGKPQAGLDEKPKPANTPGKTKMAAPPAAPNPASGKPVKSSRKDTGPKLSARQKAATERAAGGAAAWQMGSIGAGVAGGASPAFPFGTGPDRFHAVDVPLPGESGGEATSYRMIVGGVLERAKQYPESARQRRAKGIAIVGFVLDASGGVTSVVLLRSSGEADLDAESLALVNRAAPFPPPPPGAQHSFTIEVAFGMGR